MKSRVAHITPSFLPSFGGQENCILSLALRHADEWDVHVVANHKARAMHGHAYRVHNLLPFTWPLILARRRAARPFLFAQLGWLQRRYRFDVWDAHFTNVYGQAIAEYALTHRIPCVWSVHEFSAVKYVSAFYARHPHLCAHPSDRPLVIVAGARHLCNQLNALGGFPAVYVPRGLDRKRFAAIEPALRRERRAFELLTIGRNVPEKQLGLSMEMLRRLVEAGHRDIGVTIITHDVGDLAEFARRHGLEPYVRLLRSRDLQSEERFCIPPSGAIAELKAADCVISMGLYEASPNVVLEGFGAGVPVLVSNTDAHREVVENGVNGLLVSPSDPAALADAVLRLRNDRELYLTLKANAAEAGRRRDWDQSARGYADAYRQAMDIKRRCCGAKPACCESTGHIPRTEEAIR
jgi:glycosyltransferase involved in cell wall biosynthesis